MTTLAEVRARALRSLIPPPRLKLSDWIEANIVPPEGTSALPGRVRLWPYQREIADAISDPMLERVTLVKGVRLGFTTLLTGAIGGYVANEHAAILALLPTDSDARDYVVSELEPIFSATPALRAGERQRRGRARNTITSTRFADGSLRVIAARAPRNLRRVTARILLIDEADAMEVTAEGNPIRRRTMSYSTARSSSAAPRLPRTQATSSAPMARATRASSRCRAPSAARFHEITWGDIEWQADHPETAAYRCPACKALVLESALAITPGKHFSIDEREAADCEPWCEIGLGQSAALTVRRPP